MRTLTLSESVLNRANLQHSDKKSLKSFNSSSSFVSLNSHFHKRKPKNFNRISTLAFSRNSSQWPPDASVHEKWIELFPQTSTTDANNIAELSLIDGECRRTTPGAMHVLNDYDDMDKNHAEVGSISEECTFTSFNLEDIAASLMSSHSWLKFSMLVGLLTLQDSQQAIAGSEFTTGLQSIPYLGDLGDISTGFASAFLLIFFSELGDKTFFIAALLAARNSGTIVFIGTFGALAAMTVVSVVLGRTFHYVDDILPFRFGETDLPIDDIAAVCLLIYFGVSTLIDAASSDGQKTNEEQKEAELAVSEFSGNGAGLLAAANTALSTFLVVFVAEWGDKSFFSTIALAAASSPLGVIGGALAGHATATLLAVLGGSLLGTFLSEKVVAYVGGTLFLVFAAVTLVEIVT